MSRRLHCSAALQETLYAGEMLNARKRLRQVATIHWDRGVFPRHMLTFQSPGRLNLGLFRRIRSLPVPNVPRKASGTGVPRPGVPRHAATMTFREILGPEAGLLLFACPIGVLAAHACATDAAREVFSSFAETMWAIFFQVEARAWQFMDTIYYILYIILFIYYILYIIYYILYIIYYILYIIYVGDHGSHCLPLSLRSNVGSHAAGAGRPASGTLRRNSGQGQPKVALPRLTPRSWLRPPKPREYSNLA